MSCAILEDMVLAPRANQGPVRRAGAAAGSFFVAYFADHSEDAGKKIFDRTYVRTYG